MRGDGARDREGFPFGEEFAADFGGGFKWSSQRLIMEVAVMRTGRPAAPRALQVRFWEGIRSGLGVEAAARAAGAGHDAGFGWFKAAGGVASNGARPVSGRYLSVGEREEIAVGLAGGLSVREIAGLLRRSPSTVSREVGRNSRGRARYRALPAQGQAQHRARRPKVAKLAGNAVLRAHVQEKLELRWSPEQISVMLEHEFPFDAGMRVSHETIYQSLYVQGRGALRRELAACLRTGRALRKPRRREGERRGRIPGMVMISERPAEVRDRAVPGHWEGDLIVGAAGKSAIGTLVERSSRFVLLLHLPGGHDSAAVAAAMAREMSGLPAALRRSLTWDQGKEMAGHARIALDTGLDVYFCDPHSPWQRGSNENANGLLRQYFPKGTSLAGHTREHLDEVAAELNSRPRKTLDWNTPAQALDEFLTLAA
jgi:IS30 family transposase